jgi:hypothetical protein
MTEETRSEAEKASRREGPLRVRLPGFIKEEVGLGDAVKRITYAFGLQACGGCEQRSTTLNSWMIFTRY